MGLSVSLYTNLQEVTDSEEIAKVSEEDGSINYDHYGSHIRLILIHDFYLDRAKPIKKDTVYKKEYYDHVYESSYSGYSGWRELLAEMSGYPVSEYKSYGGKVKNSHAASAWEDNNNLYNMPFYEMINFSDCEGVLGTDVCSKLALDFKDNYTSAKLFFEKNEEKYGSHFSGRWMDAYESFMDAFSIASKNKGFIVYG